MTARESDASDETLMLRYQRGDHEAFRTLTERHEVPVYNFALRSLRSVLGAETVTRETFLAVVRTSTTFDHETRFAPWLFRIARRACMEEVRVRALPHYSDIGQTPANDASEGDPAPESARRTSEPGPSRVPLAARTMKSQPPGRRTYDDASDGQRAQRRRPVMPAAVQRSVVETIDGLCEEEREVFLLKEIARLSFNEIATVVDASPEAVRFRMRHALAHLHEAVGALDEYALALR